ncbi:TetR/AcrR family transcriptional regulator [Kribbella sp. NBC_01505]|uniref:TetR/AcrR family transcriptional regulator n=1 Tax=Kribbella sp. NBC_01505 TaxID=2903580 RepID=UPI00386A6D4E
MTDAEPNSRSERARVAILAAAVEECVALGYERTSVEGIARRSRSGKQTIYRRWPSKAAVLLDALVESLGDTADFPDTGDLVADLRNQMHGVVRFFNDARLSAVYRALIAAGQSDAGELRAMLDRLVEPRRAQALELLRRAQQNGKLAADIEASMLLDLLYAPLYYRLLITQEALTDDVADSVVDLVLVRMAGARP